MSKGDNINESQKKPFLRDGLLNVVSGLGGPRDKSSYNTYKNRLLSDLEAIDIYRNSWLGGKIVDVPAFESTREWRQFTMQESDENNALEKMINAENKFQLKAKIREALSYAFMLGGSAILVGVQGSGRSDEPLIIEKIKPGSLMYLHVLDKRYITAMPSGDEYYPDSNNFLDPEFYTTQLMFDRNDATFRVHKSRIIKFDGVKPPITEYIQNNFWGDSFYKRVFEALGGVESVHKAIASMTQEANVDIWSIKDLMSTLRMSGGAEVLMKRIETNDLLKSLNNSVALDMDGESIERKQISFAGLDAILEKFLTVVCSASGIPATKLLGRSPDGMNASGDSDTRNFYDYISSLQEDTLRGKLDYIDKIIAMSELGYIPKDLKFEFNPLWQMSKKDIAEIQSIRAQRDAIYMREGVLTAENVARQLVDDETYNSLTEEDAIELGDFGVSNAIAELGENGGFSFDKTEKEDEEAGKA